MTLGECIKLLRTSAGITQSDLAGRIDLSSSMLSLIEADKREPSLSVLRDIARALDVPANVMLAVALGDERGEPRSEAREQLRTLAEQLVFAAHQSILVKRLQNKRRRRK